jgi:hypothetical protein
MHFEGYKGLLRFSHRVPFDLYYFSIKGMDALKCCIPWDCEGIPVIRLAGSLALEFMEHLRIKIKVAEEQLYI